jgi:multidrug efflux pump subunit AcrA (membrane-fusion protein)
LSSALSGELVTQKSSEQKPEPLVTRLARLARADVVPEEFLKGYFAVVRAALAADGGSIWLYNSESRQLAPKISYAPEDSPIKAVPDELLSKVVYRAIEQKLPLLYYPGDSEEAGELAALKGTSLICVPIEVDEKSTIAVLLARQAREGNAFTPDNVHALQTLGAYLIVYFTYLSWRLVVGSSGRLGKLADIESDLAAARDRDKMAFIIANRIREAIVFDRVFVAFPRGSSFRVEAISGVDDAESRSAIVRNLSEVTREFARIGGDWHFTPAYLEKVEDAGLREKLTIYFETHEYQSILLTRVEDERGLLAVIAYERRQEGAYTPQDLQFLQAFAKAAAKPLRRAEDFRSLPGITLVTRLQRIKERALGPQRHRFYLKIAAAIVVLAVLAFGRMELTVKGDCRMKPYATAYAAPRISGTVREILKYEGDRVARGEVVARLDDREIDNSIRQTESQIEQKKARIDLYASASEIPSWSLERMNLDILNTELEGLKLQKESIDVTSPIDGVVITPRERAALNLDAAVQKGQPLFEIADPSKLYVEVEVDERDIGLVKPGQKINFVISGAPGRTFQSEVSWISPITRQLYGKNVFVAQGLLDNSNGAFRLEVTGSAGIPAGSRPLVYVIFRSTIDWLHSKFL